VKLRYTRPALAELNEVLDYISQNSRSGARGVQTRVKAIIELVARHPGAGARTNDRSIRRVSATPYPYLVFYEVTEDEIIARAARDPSGIAGSD
jgi:toxin ParE1/3/4